MLLGLVCCRASICPNDALQEMIDQHSGIIGSTTGNNYYVRILSTLNRELLKPSASVALHRHSNALVDILPPEADSSISLLSQSDRPDVSYSVSWVPLLPAVHLWGQGDTQSMPPLKAPSQTAQMSPALSTAHSWGQGFIQTVPSLKAASQTARYDLLGELGAPGWRRTCAQLGRSTCFPEIWP